MHPRKKSLLGASVPVLPDPAVHLAAPKPNSSAIAITSPISFPSSSIASSSAPVTNSNKPETQSFYQRCSSALTRLLKIEGIPAFFALASSGSAPPRTKHDDGQSTNPVHQLWDLLVLGVPLCILYNAQPEVEPLDIDVSCEEAERNLASLIKHAKRATALFIMGINGLIKSGEWQCQSEMFTVSELFGTDTDGFVKVVNNVFYLLDRLSTSPSIVPAIDEFGSVRKAHIQRIMDAERKYVADLEVMHEYARELIQKDIVEAHIVQQLFPRLNELLDFMWRFLIEMEDVAVSPWDAQGWGALFIKHASTFDRFLRWDSQLVQEEEFAVYEPYYENYTNASELIVEQEQNLMQLGHIIAPSELPKFLIKPIRKIYEYHMQLQVSLFFNIRGLFWTFGEGGGGDGEVNGAGDVGTYPYYDELEQGIAATKRIADRVDEAQRKAEKRNRVNMFRARVEDWKGHDPDKFGDLLLDEMFTVTKAGTDRKYHVLLFETIILCCKEVPPKVPPVDAKKGVKGAMSKMNSLLRGQQSETKDLPRTPPMSSTSSGMKISLLLKGRIFMNNVTKTMRVPGVCSLQLWWRGDEDMEHFTLRCRSEEQLTQWQMSIDQLIAKYTERRALERLARQHHHGRTIPDNSADSHAITIPEHPPPPYQGSQEPILNTGAVRDHPGSVSSEPLEEKEFQPPDRGREQEQSWPRGWTDAAPASQPPPELKSKSAANSTRLLNTSLGERLENESSRTVVEQNIPIPIDQHVSPPVISNSPPANPLAAANGSQGTRPVVISSFLSAREIARHLGEHGCQDITESLDIDSCSTYPISSGGFGDIYHGRLKDIRPVAIKTMRLQISPTENGQKSLKYAARELHIWSKCRHPNVLPLLGLVVFRDQVGMISLWLDHGSLPLYIERNKDFDRCKMSTDIANGLAYLHSIGVVHGDLKGAPELLDDREGTYSTAADIYALGMTILETFTGQVPYFGKSEYVVISAVTTRRQIPPRPEEQIPENSRQGDILWSLLKRCWAHEPNDRPSASEATKKV
ncbi:hypothetical protein FRC07_002111, partial [Ceratobasidium sp. 392]